MCKLNKKSGLTRIDPCMKELIETLKRHIQKPYKIVACCCGHGKYPRTIVINYRRYIYEYFSGEEIPRKKRFYKKDKQGYYYIPEVINGN